LSLYNENCNTDQISNFDNDFGVIVNGLGKILRTLKSMIHARTELIMRKIWIRLLAGCLAVLINLTTTGTVWASTPKKTGDPKFQGIPLQCYVSLADAGTSPEAKVAAYTEIAGQYLEFQSPDRAKKVLEKSIATAQDIVNPSLKAFALLDTAGRLTKASDLKLAADTLDNTLKIAKDLPDPVDRVFAYIKIAQAYGEAGKKEKAQNLLDTTIKATPEVIDPYARSRAFAAISNVYTELGDDFKSESAISEATQLLLMIENRNIKNRAQVEIAGSYAQAGNHAQAIASLSKVFQEFDAIRDTAIAAAKDAAKNAKSAKKSLPKTATKDVKKEDSSEENAAPPDPQVVEQTETANAEILKTRSLFLVASQYLVGKQYDKALEVIANLDAKSMEKNIGIANVAIAYAKDKKTDEAIKLLAQSLEGLDAFPPSIDGFNLLIEVGRQYQSLNKTEEAKQVWGKASSLAKKLTQPAQRLLALNIMASNYGEFGLIDQVEPILQDSFALTKTAPDPNIRSRAFSDISSAYWAIGQRNKAKEIAKEIENPKEQEQLGKLYTCAS
jgi:tetratricopeptide (TPR) repeat protein